MMLDQYKHSPQQCLQNLVEILSRIWSRFPLII